MENANSKRGTDDRIGTESYCGESAMIKSYDIMVTELTSDRASWTIIQRRKPSSVSRMVLRETPQSVRFMIIVTDPLDVLTHEIIKVSREDTHRGNTSDLCIASTAQDGLVENAHASA